MNRTWALVGAVVILLLGAAFTVGKPTTMPADSSPSGLVAVVDLERAAKDSDMDFVFQSNLAAARQDLEQRLTGVRTRLAEEVAKLQAQLPAAKDDKAKAEIQKGIADKERELQQTAADLQKELDRFILKIRQEFRTKLGPSLKKLSDAHGGKVLLTRDNNVAYVPPALDLTDELIVELKANPIQLQTTKPD